MFMGWPSRGLRPVVALRWATEKVPKPTKRTSSLFCKLAPMLSKQVPYTMGKQVSFDLFAGMLYSTLLGLTFLPKNGIALEVEVGAAFMASIVACLASHPGDVLLTATYKNSDGTSGNFVERIRRIYQDGGIFAFFRGLNARFIHVGCIITFQLVIYDQIKQALGLPASGT